MINLIIVILMSLTAFSNVYYPVQQCYEHNPPKTLKMLISKNLNYGRKCFLQLSCLPTTFNVLFQFSCDGSDVFFPNIIDDKSKFRISSAVVSEDNLYLTVFDDVLRSNRIGSRLIKINAKSQKPETIKTSDSSFYLIRNVAGKPSLFELTRNVCGKETIREYPFPGCYKSKNMNFLIQ